MPRPLSARALVVAGLLLAALPGCGTTRWSDTSRTATEQMLISDAVDRAVSEIDFAALSGRDVFVETKYITGIVDEKYILSTLRQHMLASGCVIKDKVDDATYVVELRAGAVGTNRNDLLFGIPATTLPSGGALFPVAPSSIPEVPLMKRTAQQGVCKLAVFAYERESGTPVWQSGNRQVVSKAKDVWIFGTGPFQRGTIYEGTKFAGERLQVPLTPKKEQVKPGEALVSRELVFAQPPQASGTPVARSASSKAAPENVRSPAVAARRNAHGGGAQAAYTEPVRGAAPGAPPPTAGPARAAGPQPAAEQPGSREPAPPQAWPAQSKPAQPPQAVPWPASLPGPQPLRRLKGEPSRR